MLIQQGMYAHAKTYRFQRDFRERFECRELGTLRCFNSLLHRSPAVLKFLPSLEFFGWFVCFCFFFLVVKVRGVLIPHVPELKLTKSSASICIQLHLFILYPGLWHLTLGCSEELCCKGRVIESFPLSQF